MTLSAAYHGALNRHDRIMNSRGVFSYLMVSCLAFGACTNSEGHPSSENKPASGAAGVGGTAGGAGTVVPASGGMGGDQTGAAGTGGNGLTGGAGLGGGAGAALGGASGADASAPDGPSGDTGGGLGACTAAFCDGFEGSTQLPAAWKVDNSVAANVVEVVSTKAHSGSNSVHMKIATSSGATFIHETAGFPFPMNSLWGRVWLYVMTDPNSGGHNVYIENSNGQNVASYGVRPLNTIGKNMDINVNPGAGSGEDNASAKMLLPRGVWTCFEWQIAATGAMGSVTLFMNGTQIANVPNTKIPSFVYQRIGYEHYAADSAAGEMWIDDYAIGAARITCN